MKKNWISVLLLVSVALPTFSGCSKLMGGLRRDLDDEYAYSSPTSGGKWSERGVLEESATEEAGTYYEERFGRVGHGDRRLASRQDADRNYSAFGRAPAGQPMEDAHDEESRFSPVVGSGDISAPALPRKQFKNGSRATRSDFMDESPNEGSLWASDGQTNYYFTKNKIRGVGDIVTITVDNELIKDVAMEIRRTLTPKEKEFELNRIQQRWKAKALGVQLDEKKENDPEAQKAVQKKEEERMKANNGFDDTEVRPPTIHDVDLVKDIEIKASDTILAEIIDRFPNGNYKIRGTKKILYKNGAPRLLNVVAVARSQDISEDDVVKSEKLYEYRLEALR